MAYACRRQCPHARLTVRQSELARQFVRLIRPTVVRIESAQAIHCGFIRAVIFATQLNVVKAATDFGDEIQRAQSVGAV